MVICVQIVVAGMGIPWLGYMFGYALAKLSRQPHADALAISIETGVQNTGISIFLLRYALGQPAADIATGTHPYSLTL
jgi:solute carrier family 10 (sodium/bile acid cotransporter), member 3/5